MRTNPDPATHAQRPPDWQPPSDPADPLPQPNPPEVREPGDPAPLPVDDPAPLAPRHPQ